MKFYQWLGNVLLRRNQLNLNEVETEIYKARGLGEGRRPAWRTYLLIGGAVAGAGALTLAGCGGGGSSPAVTPPVVAVALPTCAQLATDPAYHLLDNASVIDSTLTAAIIAAGPAVAANPAGSLTAICIAGWDWLVASVAA